MVDFEDRVQPIELTVEPFGDDDEDPLFLILFADMGDPLAPSAFAETAQPNRDGDGERAEQELRDTRERLQVTIEEYETAVEELKASNEELQSMNEELQSTNEELETSKEELQSVNEELQTVNSELNVKIEEVDRANSDLRNLFDSTQIATIFLDSDLIVRSFTPAVTAIFNLISTDRGRPLTDIVSHLSDGLELRRDIQAVIERGTPVERSVRRADGSANYLMRILPYRSSNNLVDGALITFVEVTTMVRAEQQQRTLVEELNHRVRNMLTVVSAIASQTLSKTPNPEDFADAFMGRIHSLGKSYSLVSEQNWSEVLLRDMAAAELMAHAESDDQVDLSGPPVTIAPPEALALGLLFHELATNAAKYGSLSSKKGHVKVSWKIVGSDLSIAWEESGGPKVGKPKRRGFGTELIERQLRESLRGAVKFDYAAEGIKVTIKIPKGMFSLRSAET